jgi:hypothetical protein
VVTDRLHQQIWAVQAALEAHHLLRVHQLLMLVAVVEVLVT